MGWGLFILTAAIGTIAGKILHEVTHALAAYAVGARNVKVQAFTLGHQYVSYTLQGARWRHRVIGLAPITLGFLVILPGYIALQGRISWDVVDIGFVTGWVWYTLRGGISDYRVARAIEPDQTPNSAD